MSSAYNVITPARVECTPDRVVLPTRPPATPPGSPPSAGAGFRRRSSGFQRPRSAAQAALVRAACCCVRCSEHHMTPATRTPPRAVVVRRRDTPGERLGVMRGSRLLARGFAHGLARGLGRRIGGPTSRNRIGELASPPRLVRITGPPGRGAISVRLFQ